MKHKALVIVDMQNDFIDGALGTPEAQAIVQNVVKKIGDFDGDLICVTKDTHNNDYLMSQEGTKLPVKHCIRGTVGHRVQKDVAAVISERAINDGIGVRVFEKNTFGCPGLGEDLSELHLNEITFVGLCTDICVISNVLLTKAFLPEVTITVDASCCAGVTPESHNNALFAMKACQVDVENWALGTEEE